MVGQEHMDRIRKEREADPFLRFFRPVNMPTGGIFYQRRQSRPLGLQPPGFKEPPITQEAADIFKQKTGKAFLGDIIAEPKAPEPAPEVETLGKSESELSRRERLRRRRDAAFQFASLQKQGGKAQSGV